MIKNRKILFAIAVVIILIAAAYIGSSAYQYGKEGYLNYYDISPMPASKEPGYDYETLMHAADSGERFNSEESSDVTERMVVYKGYITIETEDIVETLNKIRNLAESHNGYVAGSSRSSYGAQNRAEITIRIPQNQFQSIITSIESYGEVLDASTTSDDVTERYIDLKARLGNLQKQENRLHEILEMATTIEEILEVESMLTNTRSEIEYLQGQIKYLESNVEMSVITVRLREPSPTFTPPGMDWGEVFQTALNGFFVVVRGLIIITVSLLPFAIIGIPAYYIYSKVTKRKKVRKK
ncbi:MAG: DUF4349 domain-containing protein [Candidatus Bathyarchaeota archaeon]|nr:DUF4349 domain-containing protein [Candidatus Bathyarchaeota archaeon]